MLLSQSIHNQNHNTLKSENRNIKNKKEANITFLAPFAFQDKELSAALLGLPLLFAWTWPRFVNQSPCNRKKTRSHDCIREKKISK